MSNLRKESIMIVGYFIFSIVMFSHDAICSDSISQITVCISHHEPFEISSGTSSEDNSSSPEEEAENDILSETALCLAVPKHLSEKMSSLKPFIKHLLRHKKSSSKESEEFITPLRRATSEQSLPIPKVSHTRRPSVQDMIPSDLHVRRNDDDDQEDSSLDIQQQKERNKIQQLLLEAAQAALEAKELELKARSQLLKEKEKKLEEKFSKKSTAAITTGVSILTTLAGTLTAYYSSQCK